MSWIESHQALRDHPKVHDLMRLTNCDLNSTIGKLHRFWWWCLDYAITGDLRPHNNFRIGMAMGVAPESAENEVQALIQAGWIDTKPYFRVHDWWDYSKSFLRIKYKQYPEKAEEIQRLYSVSSNNSSNNRSNNRSKNCSKTANQPTNHTNQPRPTNLDQKDVSLEPKTESATKPPLLIFQTVGKTKEWHLVQEKIDEYKLSFPSLDLRSECLKARQWLIDNPSRRKTATGMSRFLYLWLSRSQNGGR